MGHAIELTSTDGFAFDAYVAQPKKTPRAAIVLLQEIFGVNAHIRAVADGFALAGFLVIAPATFSRLQKNVNLGYSADEVAAGRDLKPAPKACRLPVSWPKCKPPSPMPHWPAKAKSV
jgi:carboxymethylenebutenolidase